MPRWDTGHGFIFWALFWLLLGPFLIPVIIAIGVAWIIVYGLYRGFMRLRGKPVTIALLFGLLAADLPAPDCWPWWQCNGTKETNHPNCKCWEGK